MSSRDLFATCSVCQQRNSFRQIPNAAINKDEVRLFCSTCNIVTLQKIVGGSTPTSASAASPGVGLRTPTELDDALWLRFERAVNDSGMRMSDVFRSEVPVRREIAERLGFRPEAERLVTLIRDRHPQNLVAAASGGGGGGGGGTPAAAAGGNANGQPAAISSPSNLYGAGQPVTVGSAASRVAPAPAAPSPYLSTPHGSGVPSRRQPVAEPAESPLRGISFVNDAIIARCSVYPELPAEFWCCTCNVLVSSRCHVQGVHKDHPFITLRVAAEGHVRDLTAWSERCRSQLGITENILANLEHSAKLVQQSKQSQLEALDKYVEQMIDDLLRWKDQLKRDVESHVDTQVGGIQYASALGNQMFETYNHMLHQCDPLMSLIPASDSNDRQAEEWSLRVLDFVSKLKLLNVEPIPIPKVFVPEVKCLSTPASFMELLKQVSVPLGVRLPDILDPGYFNFPQPTSSARVPFTLQPPPDAKQKGVLIYSGRTLTRAQDVLPSQTLVCASQVFYSGTTTWEVHVDRIGAGPGRILAGIIIHGSEGEGIVWDGLRIVGPNEGECRVIDDKYVIRPGTVLRFILELDAPQHFLNCFFDRDGVARIPLPPTGNGWVPAFSVFGPQDQITVVPTSATSRLALASAQSAKKESDNASQKLREQEQVIATLQQQLQTLTMRLDAEQFRATVLEAHTLRSPQSVQHTPQQFASHHQQAPYMPSQVAGSRVSGGGGGNASLMHTPAGAKPSTLSVPSQVAAQAAPSPTPPPRAPTTQNTPPPQGAAASGAAAQTRPATAAELAYSPELQSLLKFVEEIR